jgi:hypothetical protein
VVGESCQFFFSFRGSWLFSASSVSCGFFSGSRDQLCSLPAILLWSWVFAVLVYRSLFLCLMPFLWDNVSAPSSGPCCQCVLMVCSLFFNFAELFDFGCCSLDLEVSFVDHYLLSFRQKLITGLLSYLLPFQPLFTEGSPLCSSPLLWCAYSTPPPLLPVFSVPCLLFSFGFCFCFFWWGRVQSA